MNYLEKLLDGVVVEWMALGDVCEIGTGKHDTKDATDDGNYVFYARGKKPLKLNSYDFNETAIITAGDGVGVGKVFHWVKGKYALHQRAYRIAPNKDVNSRYVYHYILANFYNYISKASVHSSVKSLRKPMFLKFQIPIPCPSNPKKSLEIQQKIVDILDTFTELTAKLTAKLTAELTARKEQYSFYREQLLSFDENKVGNELLGNLATNLDSKRKPITSGKRVLGDIPYYGASGIVDYVKDYLFDGDYLLVSEDGANLLARKTPIAFSVSGKSWVNNHAHVLEFETYAERKFVEYYLNSIDLTPYISGAAQPKLNKRNLNSIKIPNPSREEKEQIVSILDQFDTLTNSISEGLPKEIELRKKQYEYYREQLLSFPKSETVES